MILQNQNCVRIWKTLSFLKIAQSWNFSYYHCCKRETEIINGHDVQKGKNTNSTMESLKLDYLTNKISY